MNEFLRDLNQVERSVEWLKAFGWEPHLCWQKNWDLALVVPELRNGNLLDMGGYQSGILVNAVRRGLAGRKVAIDLVPIPNRVEGCEYVQGDLTHTPFDAEEFQTITCMSVIEHAVDRSGFIAECRRLLAPGGRVFATFDYWPQKIQHQVPQLDILCRQDVEAMIAMADEAGLRMRMPMNWTTGDGVLKGMDHFGPDARFVYTFGAVEFIKT